MKHSLQAGKDFHRLNWIGAVAILGLILAACAPAAPAATDTAVPSDTPAVTDTTAPVNTDTPAVTDTPAASATSAATMDATAAAMATATASGSGYGSGGATATVPATITVNISQNATLGNILVDGAGFTLYKFANDTSGTSTCNASCLANWPPLMAGSVTAGTGLDGTQFKTAMTTDGRTMITYKGSPLYYFKNDKNPGDTNGNGVGGVWSVVAP